MGERDTEKEEQEGMTYLPQRVSSFSPLLPPLTPPPSFLSSHTHTHTLSLSRTQTHDLTVWKKQRNANHQCTSCTLPLVALGPLPRCELLQCLAELCLLLRHCRLKMYWQDQTKILWCLRHGTKALLPWLRHQSRSPAAAAAAAAAADIA